MLNLLGKNYFIDFDEIEKYIDMSENEEISVTGSSEMRINIVKYEIVKMMLEVVLTENDEVDDKLGLKSSSSVSLAFKIAFNSLLNKNLINHY